ncbi:MAG: response regulator transcription factor [Bacteroidota bacterium]|nr:response regulator transcription factor [Bacteroidota bacterium]MDP4216602.1 response regulator transcription factor [Bacteroidota bacterium]MDP4245870.1 response regulator transcription factor [Bacteroidota bacterium]MDP4253659.1 response regulator transcription factor [Bacteroidota bacterium]MDP4256604.1 response regulator transcription factor [Bacteroidota bacterium]
MEKKILLADDHSLVRNGLKLIFQTQLGCKEVGQASSCNALMEELKTKKYTHIVLDINLSDGSIIEVLGNIHSLYPWVHIAIVSMQPKAVYEKILRRYGIYLFISKGANEEETIRQLRQFLQNDTPRQEERREKLAVDFTTREVEVMNYMLRGMRTNDIADALGLKGNTISTVKNRIFEKTKTENLIQLREFAALHKII